MKIKRKILLIFFLLLISLFTNVQAVNTLLNNTINSDMDASNEMLVEHSEFEEHKASTNLNPAPIVTHTSTTTSNPSLSISDIIDIILIAVCIVLIFLAIAILIRCK